jgi:hypothetical protein
VNDPVDLGNLLKGAMPDEFQFKFERWQMGPFLECGGKRSATPLWIPALHCTNQSAVAASLCRRTPKQDASNPLLAIRRFRTKSFTLSWLFPSLPK